MVVTESGKHIVIRATRWCKKCNAQTEHHGVHLRYRAWPEPTVPASYMKELTWICTMCDNLEVETKQVYEPSSTVMLINRFLRIPGDYNIESMRIESQPYELTLRLGLPPYDMGEMRAIQAKQRETGFITVDELMRLQKGGFRRARDVPPKPMPKDKRVLRERARQRMFVGEPRSI